MIFGVEGSGCGSVSATGLTNLVGVQPGRMAEETRKNARLASSCPCPGQTRHHCLVAEVTDDEPESKDGVWGRTSADQGGRQGQGRKPNVSLIIRRSVMVASIQDTKKECARDRNLGKEGEGELSLGM